MQSVVVTAHGALPLPGPPWAVSASSETSPVIFPLVRRGKAEMKLGVPETEACSYFKICLLRTLQAGVCAISGFSF